LLKSAFWFIFILRTGEAIPVTAPVHHPLIVRFRAQYIIRKSVQLAFALQAVSGENTTLVINEKKYRLSGFQSVIF